MSKAYWIAHVTVTNPEPYAEYAKRATEAFKQFNARVLARGGAFEQLEGEGHPRNVVIEFDSMEDAQACYDSEAYQSARAFREGAGIASIMLLEGV
jgi:uncharacterized protein (DUF1330 family)